MSRYGQRTRLTGGYKANTVNYWFGESTPPPTIQIDFLVVAGGAGGGHNTGGGGGAGGYRYITNQNISLSTNYIVTVGGGGAGGATGGVAGTNGETSTFNLTSSSGGGGGAGSQTTSEFVSNSPGDISTNPVPSAPILISMLPSGAVASPHSRVSFTVDADELCAYSQISSRAVECAV